jgi:hypothetical protein
MKGPNRAGACGIGVYAHVRIAVHALDRGQGNVLAWNAGLNIPAKFAPAVAQGGSGRNECRGLGWA